MKANEIRVGNYLYDSVEDVGIIQVKEIKEMTPTRVGNMSISYLGVKGGYCTTSLQENEEGLDPEDYFIQPIPLTEEWLLKFGFSDITEHCAVKVRNQKEFCISFFVGNCTEQQTMFVTLGSRGWVFKRIGSPLYKYVHQLQNLFFALTGEELILKES